MTRPDAQLIDELASRLEPNQPDAVIRKGGQFHNVLVGQNRVISLARTASAATRLPDRARKLDAIRSIDLGIATPEVTHIDEAWIEMTRVPGSPLPTSTDICDEQIAKIAKDLGQLLKRMAAIEPALLRNAGIATPSEEKWSDFDRDVRSHLVPSMSESGRQRAYAELETVAALIPVATGLVHGDLGGDNLHFVDEDGMWRLAGVVDWDEAHNGDPAEDVASLVATFGRSFQDTFIQQAGLSRAFVNRVGVIRGTFALQQAVAAYHDGDPDELADGLRDYVD